MLSWTVRAVGVPPPPPCVRERNIEPSCLSHFLRILLLESKQIRNDQPLCPKRTAAFHHTTNKAQALRHELQGLARFRADSHRPVCLAPTTLASLSLHTRNLFLSRASACTGPHAQGAPPAGVGRPGRVGLGCVLAPRDTKCSDTKRSCGT